MQRLKTFGREREYTIIVPEQTLSRAARYCDQLRHGASAPGALLARRMQSLQLRDLDPNSLLGLLFDTRPPQIFAETQVAGDGSDWNLTELGLLGDISIAMRVTVFDDGNHRTPIPHPRPFRGTLVFTPGALLRNGRGNIPADWTEVVQRDGQLCTEAYFALYRRRLLPVLRHIAADADRDHPAFVTVPGLGCGQFAGPFQGQLGAQLHAVLRRLLHEAGAELANVRAIYFDPYREGANRREEIHGISLMQRPLMHSEHRGRSQLCAPTDYAEAGDDFSRCRLYSLVAWDHVSWPGNDYFLGARTTDDGVKSAATDAMRVLTGREGRYDPGQGKYLPPEGFRTWAEVVHPEIDAGRLRLWKQQAVSADV